VTARRFLLVTQDELVVWLAGHRRLAATVRFPSSDEGFRQFSAYIKRTASQPSCMVVDVIEEEFAADTVPKLASRDRKALIERRLSRKFSRTPYRIGLYQGRSSRNSDEYELLLCSVSNHELLDPWLRTVASYKVPLEGIYSVPLLAPALLSRITEPALNSLFLTQHQHTRLRQVFLRDGVLKSARLSQSPETNDADYGEFLLNEIQRSRRYLERTRILSSVDSLDVYFVADQDLADRVLASDRGNAALQLHFIEPLRAAKSLGNFQAPAADRMESLYLASILARRPKYDYAVQGERRYSQLSKVRHAYLALATSVAVACAAFASFYLVDALYLRDASDGIESQIRRMAETFRRDNESFLPIRADSHEMKVAVDTGDYILQNRLPVPWVLHQLGNVLGDFPAIQVDDLEWQTDFVQSASRETPRARPGDPPPPVTIPRIAAVSADMRGRIFEFDGDLRAAFAQVDDLVAALKAQTAFETVVAVEYPLDARPQAALSGEVASGGSERMARFRLRMTMNVVPPESRRETW